MSNVKRVYVEKKPESAIFILLFYLLCNGFFYSVVFSLYLSYNKMNIY